MNEKNFMLIIIAGTFFFALFMFLQIFSIIIYRKRLNQHYLEKQEWLTANITETERTMNLISREVHDNIGQLAYMLNMTQQRIEETTDPEERAALKQNSSNLIQLLMSNASNISHSLDSDFIKERGGLSNVIEDAIEVIRSTGKIICEIDFVGTVRAMPDNREIVIYRIFQEAMKNVLKHAKATHMELIVRYGAKDFSMTIRDNGVGFIQQYAGKKGGIGLSTMKRRSELLNAKLHIISYPGTGSTVELYCSGI